MSLNDTNSLRERIASELNRALTDAFGNSAETFAHAVNREINHAIKHYESQPFRWNQVRRSEWVTTTAYTANVTLPNDMISMRKVEIIYGGRYYTIPKCDIDEIDRINHSPSLTAYSTSIPAKYAIEGDVLILAPPTSAARTLAGTYIKRFLPTSVTDSTTTKIVFAGSHTVTVTTTTSHKNRLNGWTTDGEELIRARAKAAIRINYLNDPEAIQEMAVIASRNEPFLSVLEAYAYKALADETFDALATGKIKGYGL